MSTRIRVVLNMHNFSIPKKINKAQLVHDNIAADAVAFPSPGTLLTDLAAAITALRTAYADTADGTRGKADIMREREGDLMDVMRQVAGYVEKLTKADAGKAAQAGLEIREPGNKHVAEFEALPGPTPGTVRVRARAQQGMFYKWQYRPGSSTTGAWVDALASKVSRALLTGIAPDFYWFRVVLVDPGGEHPTEAQRLAVR